MSGYSGTSEPIIARRANPEKNLEAHLEKWTAALLAGFRSAMPHDVTEFFGDCPGRATVPVFSHQRLCCFPLDIAQWLLVSGVLGMSNKEPSPDWRQSVAGMLDSYRKLFEIVFNI